MSMTFGTSHFDTLASAIRYYSNQGYSPEDVARKIDDGEIHIGKPEILSTEKLSVNSEGRYMITMGTWE